MPKSKKRTKRSHNQRSKQARTAPNKKQYGPIQRRIEFNSPCGAPLAYHLSPSGGLLFGSPRESPGALRMKALTEHIFSGNCLDLDACQNAVMRGSV